MMKKGEVPRPGIDTGARWGYSHTKGWIFGYKLHLTCTTGKIIVPLTADVTTANVQDNQMYVPLSSSSLVFSLPLTCYMLAYPGYDDKELRRLFRYRYCPSASKLAPLPCIRI